MTYDRTTYDRLYRATHQPPSWDESTLRRLKRYWNSGMSVKEIAISMAKHYSTIKAKLDELIKEGAIKERPKN